LPGELVVLVGGVGHGPLGSSSVGHECGKSASYVTPFGFSVGGQGGVEVGELSGEPLAGETQGFDTEGEWIIAPTAG
jgi:hypothetical protein